MAPHHCRLPLCQEIKMATLTVTSRGQVTLRNETLQHLGIRPGDKIELTLMPGGKGLVTAARPAGSISAFVGLLADKTSKVTTLDEMHDAAQRGWAGEK
jgi:bifunctional DNA-binding transcriptional regulator/antitoxin component of YhaV-PrlF toxin-antitoxin module